MDEVVRNRIEKFDFRGQSSIFIHLSIIYLVTQTIEVDDNEQNIFIGGKNYVYTCLAFNLSILGALLKKYKNLNHKLYTTT